MFGNFMVAHLIGSAKGNEEVFRTTEKALTRKGYICFCPLIFNYDEYLTFPKKGEILDEMCGAKLEVCDFLVLVTPDRVGESTMWRILQAHDLHKPVFTFEGDRLKPYSYEYTEIFQRIMDHENVVCPKSFGKKEG